MRLAPVVILPLHDPVRLAEDLCVLDHVSVGRLDVTVALGYMPSEFGMFGVPLVERGARADRALQVLRDAFDGRPFDYEGRRGTVRPGPYAEGGPSIFVGGGVPAAARRAGRFGNGFFPQNPNAALVAEYERACAEHKRPVGPVITEPPALYIHVSRDPDRDWARIARYVLHESNTYARQAKTLGQYTPYREAETVEDLRAQGAYLVLTPEECVAYLRAHRDCHHMAFSMLVGGLHPDLSWESLELLADEVLPVLHDEMDGNPPKVPLRPIAPLR